MAAQDLVDGLADGLELVGVEGALPVRGCVAGREQERVALAQRNVEMLREMEHELAARAGATGFDEAQMASGHLRFDGEVELADAPALAPVTKQVTDPWRRRGDGHRVDGIAAVTA